MKLWDKGYSTDKKIEHFTVGEDRVFDLTLAKYDVKASIAHVKMLGITKLITEKESADLVIALKDIGKIIEKGSFTIEDKFEDMHSKIEYMLIEKLGDTGKKVHMARSRNDQVLVAIHMYLKETLEGILSEVKSLFDVLLDLSNIHKEVLLPGYTHLQIAMPSSFGLWLSAYAESLIDDVFFLKAAYAVVDQNPLGSAAGYGSSFPIDRLQTTQELGFEKMKYNVVAAQMSRGKAEKSVAIGLASLASTISKFSMDICLYMSQNFNFISFPDKLTTGSSIMPHKKNPDVFELIRAKCNKVKALPNQLSLLQTNLPSGYHRDMQLTKELLMPVIEDMKACMEILISSIKEIQVNKHILDDDKYNYLFSVDTLNEKVMEGIAFRDAYKIIGKSIEEGSFKPQKDSKHTHQGSIGNLCLEEIEAKMNKALSAIL